MTTTGRYPSITRTTHLLDFEINRSGDGRTVTAYAATFGEAYEVRDQHGHYDEVINAKAFNQAVKRGAVRTAQVHFNHGLTLWGTPSDKWTEPIGTPLEIKPDGRGLLTVTRYGRTPAAEEVLQMWHDEMIRGQSFRGDVYGSRPPTRGPNGRPLIERTELSIREYGPTPNPANVGAGLVAIRSQLLDQLAELSPEERRELAALFAEATGLDSDPRTLAEPDPADPAPVASPEAEPSNSNPLEAIEAEQANRRRRLTL